jgi:hypothetical protein
VQRIEELKRTRNRYLECGDHQEMVPTMDAVITAYGSGELDVYKNPELVTYWYKGKQISQPRPFDNEEWRAIAAGCAGGHNLSGWK